MPTPKTLIAGCGYVGTVLAARLVAEGHQVWGVRRSWAGDSPGAVIPIKGDLAANAGVPALPAGLDFAVYAVSADSRNEAAYRAAYLDGLERVIDAMKASPGLSRFVFVSSTAVYAQNRGEWVDEDSPAEAAGFRGDILRRAETLVWECGLPTSVLRLAGIYGPGRMRLVERVRSGLEASPAGPPRYVNLIHREDCAGALQHLLSLEQPEPLYLGVDNEPTERSEVVRWIAREAGSAEPPARSESQAAAVGKRCRNDRLLGAGYHLAYPTYRDGFRPLIHAVEGER